MNGTLNSTLVVIATVLVAGLMLWPRLARSTLWRAMLTPLASIIGSGFLVLGPILLHAYGAWAPLAMLGLCGVAYLYGHAIRSNIELHEAPLPPVPLLAWLERLSSWALAGAYVVSVAYYLNLFGAFGVSLSGFDDPFHARLLTSAVLALVAYIGLTRGFGGLERTEQVSVGLKLAIIAGLLVGFAAYFTERAGAGELLMNAPKTTGLAALTLGFGLLITVQGFETSRYLGDTYDAPTRIRSMRWAQIVSALIYLAYVALIAYVFPISQVETTETAIIDLTRRVAPVLPALLVAAALAAQLSAALADTGGSGGLVHELSGGRVPHGLAYAALAGVGLVMTWTLDVYAIIAWASRAFALYYALQSAIAAVAARHKGAPLGRQVLFAGLAVLGFAITLFGTSVE